MSNPHAIPEPAPPLVGDLIAKLRTYPSSAVVQWDIRLEWGGEGQPWPHTETRIAHPIPEDVERQLEAEEAQEAGYGLSAHQAARLLLAQPDYPLFAIDQHGATQSVATGVTLLPVGVCLDIEVAE